LQNEKTKLSLTQDVIRIPNLFTLANIICGFISILFVIDQNYNIAGMCILFGMLFDFLDGFTAKLLRQSSEFGMQLDSFADVLTFGAAPVILTYGSLAHNNMGIVYKISLLIYFISIVYRLSKYNIIGTNKDGKFRGLPSTFSGGFISILVIWFPVFYSNNYSFLIFIFLALLSISNVPYNKLRISSIIHALVLLAFIITYIFFDKYILLSAFIIYILSGFYNVIADFIKKSFSNKKEVKRKKNK
jgi:CDP-diacylglycerol---serine O-phosphatidyltransferase